MAKFVQPTFDVYGIAEFKNKVQFDSSVYLQGVTHISSPGQSTADTPYALLVESIGADVSIQQRQLGDMAWQSVAKWDGSIWELEGLITALDTSVGNLETQVTGIDTSIGNL